MPNPTIDFSGLAAQPLVNALRVAELGYKLHNLSLMGAKISDPRRAGTVGQVHHMRRGFVVRINAAKCPGDALARLAREWARLSQPVKS